jgi:hypothetical protein
MLTKSIIVLTIIISISLFFSVTTLDADTPTPSLTNITLRIIAPTTGAWIIPTNSIFGWEWVESEVSTRTEGILADAYQLLVSTNEDISNPYINIRDLTTPGFVYKGTLKIGYNYCQVVAYKSGVVVQKSSIVNFGVFDPNNTNTAVITPKNIPLKFFAPQEGSIFYTTTSPTFSWTWGDIGENILLVPASLVDSYRLLVSMTEDMSNPIIDHTNVGSTNTNYHSSETLEYGNYFCQVFAYKDEAVVQASKVVSFGIQGLPATTNIPTSSIIHVNTTYLNMPISIDITILPLKVFIPKEGLIYYIPPDKGSVSFFTCRWLENGELVLFPKGIPLNLHPRVNYRLLVSTKVDLSNPLIDAKVDYTSNFKYPGILKPGEYYCQFTGYFENQEINKSEITHFYAQYPPEAIRTVPTTQPKPVINPTTTPDTILSPVPTLTATHTITPKPAIETTTTIDTILSSIPTLTATPAASPTSNSAFTQPIPTESASQPDNSSPTGGFLSCSNKKSARTSPNFGDGFLWGIVGIMFAGGYLVAKRRNRK